MPIPSGHMKAIRPTGSPQPRPASGWRSTPHDRWWGNRFPVALVWTLALGIVGATAPAVRAAGTGPGQGSPGPLARQVVDAATPTTPTYGPGTQRLVMYAPCWMPFGSTGALEIPTLNGYFSVVPNTSSHFFAQIPLPPGSIVDAITAFVGDADSGADWRLTLTGVEAATDLSPPAVRNIATGTTTGEPGFARIALSFDPFIVRTLSDLNEDGWAGPTAHFLVLGTTSQPQSHGLSLWGVEIHWRRTVSPAPATATFNDVPPDHWCFRYVESLAAAGITAGCGGGNYCPEAPVTRDQMAVFLASALGLHWPY